MAQQSRALVTLPDGPGLIPSIHMLVTTMCNSSSRLLWVPYTHSIQTYTQAKHIR